MFDAKFRGSFPNLTRWFVTCMNQPEFAAILGEVALCEKAKEAVAPKGAKKDKASCDPAPTSILAALPRPSQPGVVVCFVRPRWSPPGRGGMLFERGSACADATISLQPAPAFAAQPKQEPKKKKGGAAADAPKPAKPAGKAKHPLDLLPKTSMNLDEWKRTYSNLETRGAAHALSSHLLLAVAMAAIARRHGSVQGRMASGRCGAGRVGSGPQLPRGCT